MSVAEAQFETVRKALLEWLDKYGYCVYGTFDEFNKLLDKFRDDIMNAKYERPLMQTYKGRLTLSMTREELVRALQDEMEKNGQ